MSDDDLRETLFYKNVRAYADSVSVEALRNTPPQILTRTARLAYADSIASREDSPTRT